VAPGARQALDDGLHLLRADRLFLARGAEGHAEEADAGICALDALGDQAYLG
jgi:hypothetical protein